MRYLEGGKLGAVKSVQYTQVRDPSQSTGPIGVRCPSCQKYVSVQLRVGQKPPYPCPRCQQPLPIVPNEAPRPGMPALGFTVKRG